MSERMIIVESTQFGNKPKSIHPVNRVLKKSKAKNKTVLEILVNDAGCEFIPSHNFILDPSGSLILPKQIMEVYGLGIGNLRCPVCVLPFDWNTIFAHLQSDFQGGHKLSTPKTIDYFTQNFWNWIWRNSRWEKD